MKSVPGREKMCDLLRERFFCLHYSYFADALGKKKYFNWVVYGLNLIL